MKDPKLCLIGAGSTIFMKNIVGDILHLPAFKNCEIALYDIAQERLDDSTLVAQKLSATLNVTPKIVATMDRKEALSGADFVVTMFQVGGFKPSTVVDFDIPKKYGLRQTIADTLGIGGIMRAVRTIPVFLDIAEDMREMCPNATMLNYVNPMAMISWAMTRIAPDIKYVGLCHSVQGTINELCHDLDIDTESVRYVCGGINHMAFYFNIEQRMGDGSYTSLYPKLLAGYESGEYPKPNPWNPRCLNKVRYEMLKRLGYFVTESSEHFAEYTPWFIKQGREDLLEKFSIPLDEYPKRCVEQIAGWHKQAEKYRHAETIEVKQSKEYASKIVNSIWTGEPSVIYGNVRNEGLIDNLPQDCAVEVPILVDENGIQPVRIGCIPAHLAALIRTNVGVQEMVVEAFSTQNRDHLYYAAMLDPHTAAELDLDQIWDLVDELIATHGDYIPSYFRN
ncbi:alpha-glucosidase/alpha-galactosidase [Vibrio nomapromontoriensis]|uniref:alpha-glucosidase/alpha-galactosidase n=1 Tax=Vibrio nomapromontoriensis TaxID=2910246 RepID=UPI003D0C0175